VNKDKLKDQRYGSKDNPVPIMNYKIDTNYIFDQKQYEYNIKQYLAYCWYRGLK